MKNDNLEHIFGVISKDIEEAEHDGIAIVGRIFKKILLIAHRRHIGFSTDPDELEELLRLGDEAYVQLEKDVETENVPSREI